LPCWTDPAGPTQADHIRNADPDKTAPAREISSEVGGKPIAGSDSVGRSGYAEQTETQRLQRNKAGLLADSVCAGSV
jgi:hypothetical protein